MNLPHRIGKVAKYVMPMHHPDQNFNVSSKLEDVGIKQDSYIKNHSEVTIISAPIRYVSPLHGEMTMVEVFHDGKTVWLRDDTVIDGIWN